MKHNVEALRHTYHVDMHRFGMLSAGLSGIFRNTCELDVADIEMIEESFEEWKVALKDLVESRSAYYSSPARHRRRRISVLKRPKKKAKAVA